METFVEFRNASGKSLRGMIHRPPQARSRRGAPGVVFFHGFTGDRMESHWIFVKCARTLVDAGIASFRFDFYGSGESEGEFREVTLQSEISDARAAVDFFRRYRGIDSNRLGLLGLSLGGAIAASIALEAQARALVLWAALAHTDELRKLAGRTTKSIRGSNGLREYSGHAVSPRFLEHLNSVDPLDSVRQFRGPTLIIHPGKDEYLSLAHPEDYLRASGASVKEKVIVRGADHTFSSVAWEQEVIDRTAKWFTRFLGAESPPSKSSKLGEVMSPC